VPQAIRDDGIEILLMIAKTPDDVIQWVKNEANLWHGGSGFTLTEMVELVTKVETQFKAHTDEMKFTRISLPQSGENRYDKVGSMMACHCLPRRHA